MSKILTGCSFISATLAVVLLFVSATTYIQLSFAIILYIVLMILAHMCLPKRIRNVEVKKPAEVVKSAVEPEEEKTETGVVDYDKRSFLKMVGAAGISLFIYSILFKKGEMPFFKGATLPTEIGLTDANGNKIDPAQAHPMDGYKVTEVDDSVISYLGFVNKDGNWVIMKQDTTSGSFRYTKGELNFPDAWSGREDLLFDYFNNIF